MSKLLPVAVGGAMIVAIFSPRPAPAPAVPVADEAPVPAVATNITAAKMAGDLTLQRAPDGHFYTDAQRIGLSFGSSDFTETGQAAGGKIALKPVILDRVTVGNMDATHFEGVIVDGDMGVSLLGQSWLKRVGTVSISEDRMVLK